MGRVEFEGDGSAIGAMIGQRAAPGLRISELMRGRKIVGIEYDSGGANTLPIVQIRLDDGTAMQITGGKWDYIGPSVPAIVAKLENLFASINDDDLRLALELLGRENRKKLRRHLEAPNGS